MEEIERCVILAIRKYEKKDYNDLINVCLDTCDPTVQQEPINQYVKLMFCRYYIEKEPDNCVVVTDENDVAVGYVYGAQDYDFYHKNMAEYLQGISEVENGLFLPDAYVEMYNHYIYKDEYPAHLHIDIFGEHRSKGYGSEMIKAFCDNLRAKGVRGVMLIVGYDNERAQKFYERNGFKLLNKKKSGFAYGMKLTEDK